MNEVQCTRCGRSAPGLDAPPLPGEAGLAVLRGVCSECWKTWLGEQVKLINEQSLNPSKQEHYDLLVQRMREFLVLDDQPS